MLNLADDLFVKTGNSSTDGYFVCDFSNKDFVYRNKAFDALFNTTENLFDEIVHNILTNVHPDDVHFLKENYHFLMDSKETVKCDFRFSVRGNSEQNYRLVLNYSNFSGRELQVGTVENVTAERQNKVHIEQINARKNIALEVLSHDLKEPFGMMKLTASSLKNVIGKIGNDHAIEALDFIVEMCERNLKMIRSLINHEFLKSALVPIKKERVNLVWEMKDIIRFYRRSNLKQEKQFRLLCSQETIYLNLDSMKFLQAVNNLISNSIKFTEKGGLIELGIRDLGKSVLVWVRDDGKGIPERLKPILFDLKKQGLKPGLSGKDSHGLGISIIKSIVDLHDGKIWFDSKPDIGTTFFIEIPKENQLTATHD